MNQPNSLRRSRLGWRVLVATGALALAATATAQDVKLVLSGAEETPPVTTSASGAGTIKVSADKSVSGSVTTRGLQGTAAHIHVGAPGVAGPAIISLVQGPGGTWSVPPGAKLTDEQFASFRSGALYVNVHSDQHKPGEIRGQLKP